jgi:hypothetical protein
VLFLTLAKLTFDNLASVPGLGDAQRQQISDLVEQTAGTIIPALAQKPGGAAIAEAAGEAFASAVRYTSFTAAAFVFLGLLATLRLPADTKRPAEVPADTSA